MPAHGIAAVPAGLRSQFLEGLTPFERRTILAATTKRQFAARSVITNQDHPASHFYVLTKGFARYFVVTKEGKKLLLQWLGPGDLVGGRTALSKPSSYLVSTETITDWPGGPRRCRNPDNQRGIGQRR
jgi:CRP-like cAMP-binding protein